MAAITLLSSYVISIVALVFFVVAMIRGWFDSDARGARVIFASREVGTTDDPAASTAAQRALQDAAGVAGTASQQDLTARAAADASSASVVLFFMASALVWMLVASGAGLRPPNP